MTVFYLVCAIMLLLTIAAGLWRLFTCGGDVDRMLIAQLVGTTGTAVVLLLSFAMNDMRLIVLALVFALLAAVAAVAFVRQKSPQQGGN